MFGAARDLWHAWTRDPSGTLLTLLGVLLGSASLVFLASSLSGATYALARTSQQASGDDVVRIVPSDAPVADRGAAPELSERDAEALRRKEGLEEGRVGAGVTLYSREASVGAKTMPVGVQSGGARWMSMIGVELLHGRMLQPSDEGARTCVLGYDVWEQLYASRWPLAEPSLLLDGSTRLEVVGVLRRRPPIGGGSGGETWRVDRKVFVSSATLERAVDARPRPRRIAIRYDDERAAAESPKEASLRLMPYVQALHQGARNFEFDALNDGLALEKLVTGAITAVLLLGGLVAIAVGGINVMNSQLVMVAERTQEFAIRRALGLSARELKRSVLIESVAMTGVGAVIGGALGLAGAWGLSLLLSAAVTRWPFEVVPWSIGAALFVCLAAGMLAGWVPAKRASELPPAVCLRGE